MHLTTTPAKKITLATALVFASTLLFAQQTFANNHSNKAKTHATRSVHKSASAPTRTTVKVPGRTRAKAPKKAPPKTAKPMKKSRAAVTYKSSERVRLNAKDTACLTKNVYHEARGEPYAGQLAVAQVTWNRVEARQWGTSVCKVVYAPSQFSWTADPKKRYKAPRNAAWMASQRIVKDYSQGLRVTRLDDATHFHATRLGRPDWTRKLKKRMAIGNHVFYE